VSQTIQDPIPVATAWFRKMITVHTVSSGAIRGPMPQEDYVNRMIAIQQAAADTTNMAIKTAAFWKMENLSSEFLKNRAPGQSLNDPSLPLAIRPIAHCGMGIAAVEVGRFESACIEDLIESFSNPDYRLFAYEGSGAMLAVYERDFFGRMSRMSARLGLLPLAPLTKPDTMEFLSGFSPEIRRLMSHGYGRLRYFKSHSIAQAINQVRRVPGIEFAAAVQGIAFAYSMVNNTDLARVHHAGELLGDAGTARAFSDGLVYALEFWEWMAPGFFDQFGPKTRFQHELVRRARDEIAIDRAEGVLAAFAVGPQRRAGRLAT
jgi:hypothetical protein